MPSLQEVALVELLAFFRTIQRVSLSAVGTFSKMDPVLELLADFPTIPTLSLRPVEKVVVTNASLLPKEIARKVQTASLLILVFMMANLADLVNLVNLADLVNLVNLATMVRQHLLQPLLPNGVLLQPLLPNGIVLLNFLLLLNFLPKRHSELNPQICSMLSQKMT